MLKKVSIYICLILLSVSSYCQFMESKFLYYDLSDDFDSEILLDTTNTTTIVLKDKILNYHFIKDSLLVKYENENGLFVSGQYFVTHHIFSKVEKIMDADTGYLILFATRYKYPIKTGNWLFYDKNKKLVKIEVWKNGSLRDF